ncbi:MAG: outer membrane beta-barrel protein [Xanthobacteraceae bacterium]|nr:outer membrane beta-barrel protein [Xanthobacteraceae bacterium]
MGPTLLYVTAGGAWANAKLSDFFAPATFRTVTHFGYAVGAGVERMINPRWTVKLEYLFMDLGSESTPVTGAAGARVDLNALHTVRLGLNYRW